jgi:hypothetical protein
MPTEGWIDQNPYPVSELKYAQGNRNLDGAKDSDKSFRDHGQFGSFPSHDDYDEESKS